MCREKADSVSTAKLMVMQRSVQLASFILDLDRLSVRGPSGQIDMRPKSFDVLRYLVSNAGRVVCKDELIKAVWPDVVVTDDSLTRCISEIRRALGDKDKRIIKTVARRGYLVDGPVSTGGVAAALGSQATSTEATALGLVPSIPLSNLNQEIKYCRTADGVRLAYAFAGSGPPLVKTGNWLHHLQYDWESPVWRHVLRGLAEDHTLIRYDARGNGMSDWDVDNLSLEAWVSDLETVVDAVNTPRFPLLGISQGCAVSVAYAARHPERVSHLVLYGGYTLGAKRRTREDRDKRNAMLTLARLEWGADNPAFRQLFTGNFIPEATPAQADFFNELQRKTTSPECAARYLDVTGDFDITALLPKVLAPTLVMHVRGDLMVPFEEGKALAAGIPGAHFVALQGRNHFFLEDEPASERFFEEMKFFLNTSPNAVH